MRHSKAFAVVLIAVVAGCAGNRGAGPKAGESRFPAPDALKELSARPAPSPQKVFGAAGLEVETWKLTGPLPDQIGYVAHVYDDELGKMLRAAADKKPGAVLLSEAMHCIAREMGLFYLAKGEVAGQSLQTFIHGRCGALAADFGITTLSGEVEDDLTDERLIKSWREQIVQTMKNGIGTGQRFAGFWWGQGHGRAIAIVASGRRLLHLEPVPMQPQNGVVRLKGELYMTANQAAGSLTFGSTGVQHCTAETGVELPAFDLTCKVNPEDDFAWLQLLAVPPGRILGHFVLTAMLRPTGQPLMTYEQPISDAAVTASDATKMTKALADLINQVRKDGGLEAVTLSIAESDTATLLAPHYFAAIMKLQDETVADMVVLGVRAGWQIDELVRYGNFSSAWVRGTDDLSRLVATALIMPYSRQTLLDPEARHLAVGAMQIPDGGGTAAIFSSYAVFEIAAHDSLVEKVIGKLNALRDETGLPKAAQIREVETDASTAASMMQRGAVDSGGAADYLMRNSSTKLRAPVRSWILYTDSLDNISFPEELLENRDVEVAVAIAVLKPEGQAWAAYTIVIMTVEGRTTSI